MLLREMEGKGPILDRQDTSIVEKLVPDQAKTTQTTGSILNFCSSM
jgi:hypothetical protein